jgi:hypothetical protein
VSSLLVMDIPIVKVICEFGYVIEFAETISGMDVSDYILLKQFVAILGGNLLLYAILLSVL